MIEYAVWQFINWFNFSILFYFSALNGIYLLTSVLASRELRKHLWRVRVLNVEELVSMGAAPQVSVIVPAFNEAKTCVESVRSLLSLRYPDFEVIFVNDGSTDGTLELMKHAYGLVQVPRFPRSSIETMPVRGVYRSRKSPNLWVIDKENGGRKADAANAGLNYARTPLYCVIDADTVLEREALMRAVRPFLEDKRTVAVGGIVRIVNGCKVEEGVVSEVRLPKSWLARFQVMEYLRAFLVGRVGWDALGATYIVSGAFGLFRRETVVEAGGYRSDTVGEDMELTVRLHRHCRERRIPYRIRFIPDPVAWTECPETVSGLARQRDRWQRGLMDSIWRHRGMLFRPSYGRVGMFVHPYFFLFEMLGPVIEFGGYAAFGLAVLFGRANPVYIVAFLLVAIVLGVALSVAAVALEEYSLHRYTRFGDFMMLFFLAVAENFGYRQINTFWRIRAVWSVVFRERGGWGPMIRKGFGPGGR